MSEHPPMFTGSADTPYVVSAFPPDFQTGRDSLDASMVRYCRTPTEVLAAVRDYGHALPTPDELAELLSCYDGTAVVISGWEFSVEREW